jgi:hypothetical protein
LALALLSLVLLCAGTQDHVAYYSTGCTHVDGPPVTRSTVVLTADTYARVHWLMTERNRSGTGCSGEFASEYPVGPRVGMGYKFGGWDTPDSFLTKIAEGYGTGTGAPVTYEAYPFDCVVGISCTGLVSRAWHLDHKYTLTYPGHPDVPRQFHEITRLIDDVDFRFERTAGLRRGDAFINGSHIMLFLYENRDGNPMVIHASREGARFEEMSWGYLWLNGYIPIRYNNMLDDINTIGTIDRPILVDSDNLPYTHEGNTRDVVSMEFDRYSTSGSVNQPGPEVVYELRLRSPDVLLVEVTDFKDEGIDNDVYLLSSVRRGVAREALDCVARGDRKIEARLDAGTYYVVVDSGEDLPGEYELLVRRTGR